MKYIYCSIMLIVAFLFASGFKISLSPLRVEIFEWKTTLLFFIILALILLLMFLSVQKGYDAGYHKAYQEVNKTIESLITPESKELVENPKSKHDETIH